MQGITNQVGGSGILEFHDDENIYALGKEKGKGAKIL